MMMIYMITSHRLSNDVIIGTVVSKQAQINLKIDVSKRFCVNYIGWILFTVSVLNVRTV